MVYFYIDIDKYLVGYLLTIYVNSHGKTINNDEF